MITVYEIKPNGFLGGSREIEPSEGVGSGWTYTAPPDEGSYRWDHGAWVEAEEPPESFEGPDVSFLASAVRRDRDLRLVESDWTQTLDAPVDQEAWAAYRQALRDVPEQEGFPFSVIWPVSP